MFLCVVLSGHTPFAVERPTGDQTAERRRRPAHGRGQESATRTQRHRHADRRPATETAGAHTAAVFPGSEEVVQDHDRRRSTADGGRGTGPTPVPAVPGGRVAGQQPASRRLRRQTRVAADIADPAESVAQRGSPGRVRPDARPHRVPGNEPGRDQVRGETQRQLQAGQRHQSATVGQVTEHADGAAKGPQRADHSR